MVAHSLCTARTQDLYTHLTGDRIAWKQLGRTFNNKTILAKLLTAVISNHFLLNFLIGVTAERGFE